MEITPTPLTPKEYEGLVQELYQSILNTEEVNTIKVQKNLNIKGKSSASHQIDIYWEFYLAGIKYKTCVECKMLGRKVEKGDVLEFNSKIEDIGNITGIFVTTKGYQEGAITYGEYKNIRLIRVIPAATEFKIKAPINFERLTVEHFHWDAQQINGLVKEHKKKDPYFTKLSIIASDINRGTLFFNSNGDQICTFNELLEPYKTKNGLFNVPTKGHYIKIQIGLCELLSFDLSVSQDLRPDEEFILKTEPVYKAIMHDITQNISYFLKADDNSKEKFE